MKHHIKKFIKSIQGATAIEYALIGALIAVVIIVSVKYLGSNLSDTYATISNGVSDSTTR